MPVLSFSYNSYLDAAAAHRLSGYTGPAAPHALPFHSNNVVDLAKAAAALKADEDFRCAFAAESAKISNSLYSPAAVARRQVLLLRHTLLQHNAGLGYV